MFLGSVSKTVPTVRKGIEVGRNELDSKSSCPGDRARGFESHPFRHQNVHKGLCLTVKGNKVLFFQAFSFRRRSWLTIVEHAKLGDLCRSMYRFCLSCLGRLTPTFTKSYKVLIMNEKTTKTTTPLSAATVNKALRDGHPSVLKDTGSLCLKVLGKNKGTWIYRGRLAGTTKIVEVTCGTAPETGLSAARQQRDKVRLLLKDGINPNEKKKAKQIEEKAQAESDARTFGAVADEYFRMRGDMSRKGLQSEQGRVKNHMTDIRDIPVAQIERLAHLKPIIDKLVQRGEFEQARRVAGLIGRIMNFSVDMGYIKFSPADHLVRLIPRQAQGTQRHHAALVTVETASSLFQRVWSYCERGRSSPFLTAALKLSCYMPIRNGNMVEAQWEQINFEKGLWLFQSTKNGRAYTVPLTRQIRDILENLKNYRYNRWCFPSGAKTGHISNGGMSKLLRVAGVPREEHSLHGFRSTFETLALEFGLPKALCERLLLHVAGGSVEQAHIRASYESAISLALQWWNDTVDALRMGDAVPDLPSPLLERYR